MCSKSESKPNIKHCLGRKVKLVQRFTNIQNFGHNWRRVDGIRVEYFPKNHTIAAHQQSPRVHDQNGRPITIQRTNYLHDDVQWHHLVIWRQWTGMQCWRHTCVFIRKRFPAGLWSFLRPGSEKKWYSDLYWQTKEENGTESLNWWWSNSERADTQFSEPRVHCPEERSKAKEVENYQNTSVPMVIRLKLFFAQLFLLISSVSTEQSYLCDEYNACEARTERLVVAGQSDPLFDQANLLMKTPTPSTEDPAQERKSIAKV